MNPFEEHGPRRSGFYFLQGYHAHRNFCEWVKRHKNDIQNVLEYGCGYFEYYSNYFGNLQIDYTGLDLSEDITTYRKSVHPDQTFLTVDFSDFQTEEKFDLVFSHMVIAGELEEETNLALLTSNVQASKRYGYVVIWNTHNVDMLKYKKHLKQMGCLNIRHRFVHTGLPAPQPPYEMVLNWEQ